MRDLRHIQLFEGLSSTQINHALSHMRKVTVRRGEYIFLTGEKADYMFLLEKGLVKISYITSDGDERIIDFRDDGGMFGSYLLDVIGIGLGLHRQ